MLRDGSWHSLDGDLETEKELFSTMKYVNIKTSKWIDQIFKAKIVDEGGVVRRSVASVRKYASPEALEYAVKRRGFHMNESAGQYIIYCNDGDIRLNC